MSNSNEATDTENLSFSWGKKRGLGGKKKEVQFYESFTYDGEEYSLYDNVYLYKEGEPEPYIGKLVKIWEQPESKKKVKVLWFFRPVEILNFLGEEEPLENELFLASGEGAGLANVNPLEAIAGKCNVICTSKDSRNLQPSEDELRKADYAFLRTFDVGTCTVSDRIDDKIAGIEVRYLLNGKRVQKSDDTPKLETGNKVASVEPSHPVAQEDFRASLVEEEHHSQGSLVPDAVTETIETGSASVKPDRPDEKTISRPTADSSSDEGKTGRKSIGKAEEKDKLKFTSKAEEKDKLKPVNDFGLSDDRPSKKARLDNSAKQSEAANVSSSSAVNKIKNEKVVGKKLKVNSDGGDAKPSATASSTSGDMTKSKLVKDSIKKVEPDEKTSKILNGTVSNAGDGGPEKNLGTNGEIMKITKRPDADRSKWFKGVNWEDRMNVAHAQGRLVFLENLDPTYTSGDIEDIMWHTFRESCTARMVPSTAISSPHSGQAFVIFKSSDSASMAVKKLEDGCLMLPSGRPLVASWGSPPPKSVSKHTSFVGHLVIDKAKFQMQREEMRRAVSTSHCSQPNTVEYEMAMEWCLLGKRSDIWWAELYKQHGSELKKLQATLKSK